MTVQEQFENLGRFYNGSAAAARLLRQQGVSEFQLKEQWVRDYQGHGTGDAIEAYYNAQIDVHREDLRRSYGIEV